MPLSLPLLLPLPLPLPLPLLLPLPLPLPLPLLLPPFMYFTECSHPVDVFHDISVTIHFACFLNFFCVCHHISIPSKSFFLGLGFVWFLGAETGARRDSAVPGFTLQPWARSAETGDRHIHWLSPCSLLEDREEREEHEIHCPVPRCWNTGQTLLSAGGRSSVRGVERWIFVKSMNVNSSIQMLLYTYWYNHIWTLTLLKRPVWCSIHFTSSLSLTT